MIYQIPHNFLECITILDKPCSPGLSNTKQPHYHLILNCTYWNLLGTHNNWNTTKFNNKYIFMEYYDDINGVVIDVISDKI